MNPAVAVIMDADMTEYDILLMKHKKERKEIQAETVKLKHAVPKGDKKKKKDVMAQTALMLAELDARQEEELHQLKKNNQCSDVSENLAAMAIQASNNDDELSASIENTKQEQTRKVSKAEKRRNLKAAKERQREEEIRQYELESRLHDPGVIAKIQEKKTISVKLAAKGLQILEVPSDGDCLYSAVSRMMQQHGSPMDVSDLRCQTAEHMRKCQDDYLPFLCHPETGDQYTTDEYMRYCDRIENTPEWGGQIEIQAMSNVLKKKIEVVQGDGVDIIIGEEFKDDPCLVITYHRLMYKLGEHYNATMPRKDDQEDST